MLIFCGAFIVLTIMAVIFRGDAGEVGPAELPQLREG